MRLVPLTILPNAKAGEAPLQALVKWLECEKLCVPGSNVVSAALTIGTQTKQSSDFFAIESAKKQLPSTTVPGTVNMQWGEGSGDKRSLKIEWVTDNVASADFYPHDDGLTKISASTKFESTGGGKVVLSGHVRAWYERQAAERAAWAAPGVTQVVDRIAVY